MEKNLKSYFIDDPDVHIKIIEVRHIFKDTLPQMRVEIFEQNENIVSSHKPLNKLYYLLEGKAKITLGHEDGKRSIINFVRPKAFIGELTLIGVEKQPKDVTAIGTCKCLTISISLARETLLKDEFFLLLLCRYIGDKYLERAWFNSKQQSFPLKHRLAAYILLSENNGVYKEKHTQTSEFLSVSYRHLLYTIQQFKDENILKKTDRGYLINKRKLKELADILE